MFLELNDFKTVRKILLAVFFFTIFETNLIFIRLILVFLVFYGRMCSSNTKGEL